MSTLLDQDTIALEGLDIEIPCVESAHPAELMVMCRFCGVHAFWCRKHWDTKRRRVEDFLASTVLAVVQCATCGAETRSVDELMRVVNL